MKSRRPAAFCNSSPPPTIAFQSHAAGASDEFPRRTTMKMPFSIAVGLVAIVMSLVRVSVADTGATQKYSLSIAQVYESNPQEWVFIFGGTGPYRGGETVCKSVQALKKLLTGLPRGSTLDWSPTCHGESVALKDDLEDLKKLCTKAGITFTVHPSG